MFIPILSILACFQCVSAITDSTDAIPNATHQCSLWLAPSKTGLGNGIISGKLFHDKDAVDYVGR